MRSKKLRRAFWRRSSWSPTPADARAGNCVAATSLARLYLTGEAALQRPAEYWHLSTASFNQGLETADLKEARALLNLLAPGRRAAQQGFRYDVIARG